MKVRDVIKKLLDYNPEAEFNVIAFYCPHDFTVVYGKSEGIEKHNCECVDFYIDDLCTTEKIEERFPPPTIQEEGK